MIKAKVKLWFTTESGRESRKKSKKKSRKKYIERDRNKNRKRALIYYYQNKEKILKKKKEKRSLGLIKVKDTTAKERQRRFWKKNIQRISDRYIISILTRRGKRNKSEITQNMILERRQQIINKRIKIGK